MVFAVYVSLIPFDLRVMPLAVAWDQFWVAATAPGQRLSRTNFLANVLLFVPLGFALMGMVLLDRRASLVKVAAAFVVTGVLSIVASITAEFLQVFAEGRVPSGLDVLAQAIGTGCGIAAWALTGRRLTEWLRAALTASQGDRVGRVLTAYAVAWAFVNLAPFDITVDLGQLARRFRSGDIVLVPFGSDIGAARLAWDGFAAAISAFPLGLFGALRGARAGGTAHGLPAFGVGASLVALMEVAHIFIRSHSADVTDVLLGWIGVAVGVLAAPRLFSVTGERSLAANVPVRRWAAVALAAWCVVLAAYHWLPYDFVLDTQSVRGKLARMSLLPFTGYSGSDLNAFNDVLLKLALATPCGVLAALVIVRPRLSGMTRLGWLALAAVVFAAIEVGQFFLPTRIPDATDVLLGIVGTQGGLMIARYALPVAGGAGAR